MSKSNEIDTVPKSYISIQYCKYQVGLKSFQSILSIIIICIIKDAYQLLQIGHLIKVDGTTIKVERTLQHVSKEIGTLTKVYDICESVQCKKFKPTISHVSALLDYI